MLIIGIKEFDDKFEQLNLLQDLWLEGEQVVLVELTRQIL